jgi:anti-sigma regulatory factor (Ser/Thr protein kinase)
MEEGRVSPQEPVSQRPARLSIELAPDLAEISRLTEAFESLAGELQLPPAAAFELTLVLDELVTNVINYGGIAPDGERIRVEFRADDEAIEITISDPGKPFDPRGARQPDIDAALEDRKIGGLGVHLARNMVDVFAYRHEHGRNLVTLLKRIDRSPA